MSQKLHAGKCIACRTNVISVTFLSFLAYYSQFPNTLAGVVGNEVMDSLSAWKAAPCIKAYVRDLKLYMKENLDRSLPLVYTAQDNGIGAAVTAPKAMRLTANYLSCRSNKGDSSIDVFGINVESWCSSTGTFKENDDGSEGTYYSLWKALHNTSVGLVFAEMVRYFLSIECKCVSDLRSFSP